MNVRKQVTIVQHVEPEGPGAIAEALRARDVPVRLIRVHEGEHVPSSIHGLAGLVVMGGPMGIGDVDSMPHLRQVIQLLHLALLARLPVLGICLGSQLLASALGAAVRRGARKEIGWHQITLADAAARDVVFARVPRTFDAFHWHGDIFDLPPGADLLASSEATACQAFRWREHAYGLLFHLEVDQPAIQRMASTFAGELAEAGLQPGQLMAASRDRIAPMRLIGEHVFDRWAELAAAYSAVNDPR